MCVLLPGAEWGVGEGGGKWLFFLSAPDLLIMVIVTVTHRSDSDGNIITEGGNKIVEFREIVKGLLQL